MWCMSFLPKIPLEGRPEDLARNVAEIDHRRLVVSTGICAKDVLVGFPAGLCASLASGQAILGGILQTGLGGVHEEN